MTNGEKIQEILDIDRDCVEVHGENGTMTFTVTQDWWNAEYKEPTTKNDLGVDAVSRKAVLNTLDSMDSALDEDRTVETYKDLLKECYKVLPSVTPQEPKTGHWIEEFVDTEGEVRFTCSCCGKYQLFGTDFCYNCGSDNREVEE